MRTSELGGMRSVYAPYLKEAFDGGTKVTQLAKAKLGAKDLGMGQEYMEAGTLEEYAAVLSFELSRRKRYTAKIVLGAEAQDPDNGAPILAKSMDFERY
ncbi:hypothetical protein GW17_00000425 [Ensete ventricosum]|nr:hypothetical protein GW17_00000425 [Ensete ventricosum]